MTKRFICVLLTVLMLLSVFSSAYADSVRNWIEPSFLIRDDINIDEYTTTWYTPWLANYHFTEPIQLSNFHKGGENGQRCWAAAISPTNPEEMLIGGDTWGIYRSSDGGNSWSDVSSSFEPEGISGLIYHPDIDGVAYAMISNDTRYDQITKSGIYKTADGGETWRMVQQMRLKLRQTFYNMAFSNKDENGKRIFYAASQSDDGLWYSLDDGETFTYIGLNDKSIKHLSVDGEGLLISTLEAGLLYTKDLGKTYEPKNNGLEEINGIVKVTSAVVNPTDDSNWFCLNYGNVYESKNSGASWEKIYDRDMWDRAENMVYSLVFSAANEEGHSILYCVFGDTQITYAYSNDYGKSWQMYEGGGKLGMYSGGAFGWPYHPLITSPTDHDVMICSLDDEIYKSIDGGKTLNSVSSGLSGYRVTDWWFNPDDPYDWAVSCIDRGVLRSVDMGIECEYPCMTNEPDENRQGLRDVGPTAYTIDRDPKDPNRWLCAVGDWTNGSIWESTNGGVQFFSIGLPTMNIKNMRIRFNRQHPDVIYATNLVSYDNGKTWEKPTFSISGIFDPNNDIVYHASQENGIWKSTDCGKTWKQLYQGGSFSPYITTCDYSKEDRLFFGTWNGGGIYIFDDGILTKYDTDDGFKTNAYGQLGCYEIAQDPNNPAHLVTCANDSLNVAKSAGVFESYDTGKTWKHIEGLPSTGDAWSVRFHPTLPRVFIATSAGTFSYEFEKYRDLSNGVFLDIDESYAKEKINSLYNLGIINKHTDGYFKPQSNMKRGEFLYSVRKLMNYSDMPYGVTSLSDRTFIDVDEFNQYFTYVQSAYNAGLIKLPDDWQFKPYDMITYDEAAAIISRLLDYCGKSKYIDPTLAENTISSDVNIEFRVDFYKLYYYNIFNNKMKFNPKDYVTKEDLAEMLYNTYMIVKN